MLYALIRLYRHDVPIEIRQRPNNYRRAAHDEYVPEHLGGAPARAAYAVDDCPDEIRRKQKVQRRVKNGHEIIHKEVGARALPHLPQSEDIIR